MSLKLRQQDLPDTEKKSVGLIYPDYLPPVYISDHS